MVSTELFVLNDIIYYFIYLLVVEFDCAHMRYEFSQGGNILVFKLTGQQSFIDMVQKIRRQWKRCVFIHNRIGFNHHGIVVTSCIEIVSCATEKRSVIINMPFLDDRLANLIEL